MTAMFVVNIVACAVNAALYAADTSRWWSLGAAVLSGGFAVFCALAGTR